MSDQAIHLDESCRFIIQVVRKAYTGLSGQWWCDREKNYYHVTSVHILMYFFRKYTDQSLYDIGQICGGRTEAAVISALRKIEAKRHDHRFAKRLETMDKKLRTKLLHKVETIPAKRRNYRAVHQNTELPPHIESELITLWNICCEQYGYYADPKVQCRRKEFTQVRFLFYYLAYETGYFSLVQLAIFTGKSDHTTVINGRDKVADLLYITPNGRPVEPELYRRYLSAKNMMQQSSEYTASNTTQWLTAGYL